MGATDVVQGYFDAWNRHDPEAIAATFVQGGTYTDPNVPEGLSGRAIVEYASGLFAAFPDLLFDLDSHSSTDDGMVAARWVMRGTNTGPLRETLRPEAPSPYLEPTSSRWRETKSARCKDTSTVALSWSS